MMHRLVWIPVLALTLGLWACETDEPGESAPSAEALSGEPPLWCADDLPYATVVLSYELGENAGMGSAEDALGPPEPGPPLSGTLDVISLGVGGEIIVGFGGRAFEDGPGPDLVVWENAFWIGGDEERPFAEFGEVSVSEDGELWHAFPCDPEAASPFDSGCAGVQPRREFEICDTIPLESARIGGDAFDLAQLGLESARYVRIRDRASAGIAPSAGFDLDAVGAVYFAD